MNTLSKSITHNFFKNPEDYTRMRKAWSELTQKRTPIPFYIHAYYLILCGKNWTKGFTMPKRFCNPAEVAIVRCTYLLPMKSSEPPKHNSSAYEFFAEFLAPNTDSLIADLIDTRNLRVYKAVQHGVPIEPYLAPVGVQLPESPVEVQFHESPAEVHLHE